MMRLKSCFLILAVLWVGQSYAQVNILNADTPDEIGQKTDDQVEQDNTSEPLPYGYTEDRDILWSKSVWEYIDLKQRANFPFLYPVDSDRMGRNRKSLYKVLLDNVKNGNIRHIYADSYFNREETLDDLEATLHDKDTLDKGIEQLNAGEELDEQYVTQTDVDASDVQGFRIRGLWYFDKRQGDLRYRPIGIAPVVTDAYSKSHDVEDPEPVELFWVFYPEAREALFNAQAYNPNNSARPFNFDELINSRRFSAVIYKTGNEHGDREIKDYIPDNALKQLLEADRIKEKIRNFEADMWNY